MNNPFKREIEKMKQKREKAVEEVLLMVEADAKLLCPVDTGNLKRSITHDIRTDKKTTKGAVGSNVEYAYFAEKKRAYMEPAVDKNLDAIKKLLERELKK